MADVEVTYRDSEGVLYSADIVFDRSTSNQLKVTPRKLKKIRAEWIDKVKALDLPTFGRQLDTLAEVFEEHGIEWHYEGRGIEFTIN